MAAELPTAQSQLHSRLASFAALSTEQAKGTRDCLTAGADFANFSFDELADSALTC